MGIYWPFLVYSFGHFVMVLVALARPQQEREVIFYITLAQSVGLVYDNLVLFLTPRIANQSLTLFLNKGRFLLHSVITPLLLIGLAKLSLVSHSLFINVIPATLLFVVVGFVGFTKLSLQSVYEGKVLTRWTTNHANFWGVMTIVPSVVAVFSSIYLGYFIYSDYGDAWLFLSSLVMFICASKPQFLALGNFGEVVYLWGLWHTLFFMRDHERRVDIRSSLSL
eukprot:TRINITY_DN1282_c0_g1_i3.p1 TRINITY_DN1282_c0_g1~~TRINITY_DN1282_c0_g1_i3.p1  ORF type:complete len:223 (-),score=15.73 TRINITY_DN1282_c0_g1_i3:73-741(-)